MDSIREQMAVTKEISEAISGPVVSGTEMDEEELDRELAELEGEVLDDRLKGAERAPVHIPTSPTREIMDSKCSALLLHRTAGGEHRCSLLPSLFTPPTIEGKQRTEEEAEEERQLRELQASLSM